ncbi:MAG: DUF3226 domain-containing protein [Nannocystaceae bacterium]
MRRAYFVVEGPHEVEVVGRLLRLHALQRMRSVDELDPYWRRLVPRSFPYRGDLLKRVPVPVFFASNELSVAVQSAGGISRLLATVDSAMNNVDSPLDGIGVVLDADDSAVERRWASVATKLPVADAGAGPGRVSESKPRAGVYVLPDNERTGTLEHLLLACAERAYPSLLQSARAWIEPLDPHDRSVFSTAKEREDLAKPSGKTKAIVASIASVLRPGKSIQVSIQDNQWLRHPEALAVQDVLALRAFVAGILGTDDG